MLPALESLIELQRLDSEAERARRRLAELPAAEQEIEARIAAARATLDAATSALAENQQARRALEKDVAQVDSRLARFDEHRAAVKTNQEYTALLHEIDVAKGEKNALEDQILVLLEAADAIAADIKAAEDGVQQASAAAEADRQALRGERQALEAELARIAGERSTAAAPLDASLTSKYEQLLKQRRGVAVARMEREICSACHVRLRPSVAQQVRRNDAVIQCESCQRILYAVPAPVPQEGA